VSRLSAWRQWLAAARTRPGAYVAVAATLLGAYALFGTGMVAYTHAVTQGRIAANEREQLMRAIGTVLPANVYDNDPLRDTRRLYAPKWLGADTAQVVYRARRGGRPAAAVFSVVAPDGYGGPIHLLVCVAADGRVLGVRVVSHQETPGLGDAIDSAHSNWVGGFAGRRLGDPPLKRWKVKRDGGVFDQFTGATISPRAVVGAVRRCLQYFRAHREAVFASAAGQRSVQEENNDE